MDARATVLRRPGIDVRCGGGLPLPLPLDLLKRRKDTGTSFATRQQLK